MHERIERLVRRDRNPGFEGDPEQELKLEGCDEEGSGHEGEA